MKIEHFNPELKIQKDAFAWRYMNFKKISDLLFNNVMYFSRLDTFDDPIEGIPFNYRAKLQFKNVLKCEISKEDFNKITNFKIAKDHLNEWQRGTYSSCWYLTEIESAKQGNHHHELLAMWNFFNDDCGFVIKVNFQNLLSIISDSLVGLIDQEIVYAKYGKVYYLNYGEYNEMLNTTSEDLMPALIKHNSYRYENEIRFLLLRKQEIGNNDRKGIRIILNKKLNTLLEIEIFSHPEMDSEKFKFYRNKFKEAGFDLKVSSILTKKVVENLLNNQ